MLAFTNTNTLFLSISPRSWPPTPMPLPRTCPPGVWQGRQAPGFWHPKAKAPWPGPGVYRYTCEAEVIFLEKKDHDLFLVMLKKGNMIPVNPDMSIHEHLQDVLISIPPESSFMILQLSSSQQQHCTRRSHVAFDDVS